MNRRGVSQIIGSLFMLAVVAALGSLLLFTGIENITDFNLFLQIVGNQETDFLNEDFIIEHVRFDPDDPSTGAGQNVTIWIRNTGTVDLNLERITIHHIEDQYLIIYDEDPSLLIFPNEIKKKSYGSETPSGDPNWLLSSDPDTVQELGIDNQYRISVTTTRGNTVEAIVKPYNT